MSSSSPPPRYRKGDVVVDRANRQTGRVESEPIRDGGEYWYRVRFERRTANFVENELDPLDEADNSIEGLVLEGRWGPLVAFRRALALHRIAHTNRSTIYSFNANRILFQPYQYKPLLKILDSPDRRLLVADEVGLGKTIEAGLILTELQARETLDRVLIVCPSRLRDKWREELNRKFDLPMEIFDKAALQSYVRRVQERPSRSALQAIISFQSLRQDELREQLIAEVGHLDAVVFDEAHHARNPGTLTSGLLRDLGRIARTVVLLTATPLHLGSRDLYTLVNALRPSAYRNPDVFDQELRTHRPILKASEILRRRSPKDLKEVRGLVEGVFRADPRKGFTDPLAKLVAEDLERDPPSDRREWVELERRLQDLHPLSAIVTRTRKRDVQEHAPQRRARVIKCAWTEEEDAAYMKLVHGSGPLGWIREHLTLGQIQRARQAASCIPAAIAHAWRQSLPDPDEESESTDLPSTDMPEEAARRDESPPPALTVPSKDSKYEKLRGLLSDTWLEEPNAKVLIFTFFLGTASYLQERLAREGVRTLRIAGDVPSDPLHPDRDERGRVLRAFREDPSALVLVSTEVGSEGLDFEFCHRLVNYDLPWNPMVVEQRIGRIDRFGQKSDVVHIVSLVVEGTVEERILARLYQRIGVFRHSMGDLETIVGDTMRELQRDYVRGRLTPTEAELRVDQAARAIAERHIHLEELERKADDLFGHEDYVRMEIARVRHLGRFVSEGALIALIEGFLSFKHPGLHVIKKESGIFGLRLTERLRAELRDASPPGEPWLDRTRDDEFVFTTDGEKAFGSRDVELVRTAHPLIRASIPCLSEAMKSPTSRVSHGLVDLSPEDDPELLDGGYLVVLFSHEFSGMRPRTQIDAVAWFLDGGTLVDPELSERLLHLATECGSEWEAERIPQLRSDAWSAIVSEARRRNRTSLEEDRRESAASYARRRRSLESEYQLQREDIEAKLRTARERDRQARVLRLFEAQLQKAEARYQVRLTELDGGKMVTANLSDPIAACLIRLRHRLPK